MDVHLTSAWNLQVAYTQNNSNGLKFLENPYDLDVTLIKLSDIPPDSIEATGSRFCEPPSEFCHTVRCSGIRDVC